MTNFPQDVYARNLLSHRGYPLWTPEPNIELPPIYQLEGLKLGDVGVVVPEEGSFDVFFNITLSREHPLHAADGVPKNFTQVELRREDFRIVPDAESPGRVISSPTVECAVRCIEPHYLDGVAHRLTDHQFGLHQNEGAMLVLPQGAERHRIAKGLLLLDVIIQNAVEWYRFAREQLYRDISNDALYLITGFHKTQSWSLASFKNIGASSAHCKIVQLRKGGPMLADESTWETIYPLEWRVGPRHSVAVPNQSVFITGFKIAINEELLHLKRVTVKVDHSERTLASQLVGLGATLANLLLGSTFDAGHSSEVASQDEEANELTLDSPEDEHEHVRVEHVPQVSQPFHPSDIINRYMLKKEPAARIAVTHDSQWISLLEKGILRQQDMLQEGRLEAVVSQECNIVTKDGAVYLESNDDPTDMGTAIAALFDLHDTHPPTPPQISIQESKFFGGPPLSQYTSRPRRRPTTSLRRIKIPAAHESQALPEVGHGRKRDETIGKAWNASHAVLAMARLLITPILQDASHAMAPPDEPDVEVFVVGQMGAGKSTLINMIMPGKPPATVQASHDARPCTRYTTPYTTVLKGGLQCRLWDTEGIDGGSDGKDLINEGMYTVARMIREQSQRLRGSQDETKPAGPILMWCIHASQISNRTYWRLFRRAYVNLCGRMVVPVIVVTQITHNATGWESVCRQQLKELVLGPDETNIQSLGVRRYQNLLSLEYREDCRTLRDLITRLAHGHDVDKSTVETAREDRNTKDDRFETEHNSKTKGGEADDNVQDVWSSLYKPGRQK